MRSVSVAELKTNVSRYLDEVLAGEEVLIEEHDLPVAKIIPFGKNGLLDPHRTQPDSEQKARSPMPLLEEDPLYITDADLEAHIAQLAAENKIRLGEGPLPPEFWAEPPVGVPTRDLVRLVSEDRDED